MSIDLVMDTGTLRLYHGDACEYPLDDVDLVLTNPYAALPTQLCDKPMILSHDASRKDDLAKMAGVNLIEVARWNCGTGAAGVPQAVWVANMQPIAIDLGFLSAEAFAPARGWWPLDLPVRLLEAYAWRGGLTVWDGFAGRGTTGKAAQVLGHKFVGIDISIERVNLALRYLNLAM